MILFASSCVNIAISLILSLNFPSRIDHVDAVEAGSRAAVGHSRYLGRLAFSIEESTKKLVIIFVTNLYAGVPEFLCIGLVGNVFQHLCDLPVFNLIEELTSELEVVALLVDGVGASTGNINSFFHVLNHLVGAKFCFTGR